MTTKVQNNGTDMATLVTCDARVFQRHWHSFAIKVVSPLFLAVANLFLVFVAILFPPQWFESAASEPDVVFLNFRYALLAIACTMAFLTGIVFYRLSRGSSLIIFRKSCNFQPNEGLLRKVKILLRICLAINLVTVALLIYGIGPHRILDAITNVSVALSVRNEALLVGRIAGLNILALQSLVFIILIAAFFVILNSKTKLLTPLVVLFSSVIITYLFVTVLTITRWPILQLLFSMLVLYILYLNTKSGMGAVRIFTFGILSLAFSLIVFLGIGILKYGPSHVIGSIIGYTIASYNLGAAVVSGIFRQPNSGSTFATLGFFWQFPFLGEHFRLIGISYGLNLPIAGGANMSNVNAWSYVIATTTNLNPHWNWDTVYAYVYGDIGWASLFVFFLYGSISQYLYEGFVRLRLFHVTLYSFFFVYQITWFTSVFISGTLLDDYVVFACFLVFYLGPHWKQSRLEASCSL